MKKHSQILDKRPDIWKLEMATCCFGTGKEKSGQQLIEQYLLITPKPDLTHNRYAIETLIQHPLAADKLRKAYTEKEFIQMHAVLEKEDQQKTLHIQICDDIQKIVAKKFRQGTS